MNIDTDRGESAATMLCPVGPEDLQAGQYVVELYDIDEFPRGLFSCEPHTPITIERLISMPATTQPPRLIVEACLPLLLVKDNEGRHAVIDVRRFRLAIVPARFAVRVFEKLKKDRKAAEKRRKEVL